jgi:microcystin-dependent protein
MVENMTSWARDFFTLSAHQKPTVGDTKTSIINWDHLGWLKCDGRLVNVADYYFLHQVIGYNFGGSGTQFRLPNPFGKVVSYLGSNTGTGSNWTQLGQVLGAYTHTLTIAEMPTHNHSNVTDLSGTLIVVNSNGAHTHGITDPQHAHSYTSTVPGENAYDVAGGDQQIGAQAATTGSSSTGITINSAGEHAHTITDPTHNHRIKNDGGSNAHNNIQPTIFMGNMFIYSGLTGGTLTGGLAGKFPYDLTAGNIY